MCGEFGLYRGMRMAWPVVGQIVSQVSFFCLVRFEEFGLSDWCSVESGLHREAVMAWSVVQQWVSQSA